MKSSTGNPGDKTVHIPSSTPAAKARCKKGHPVPYNRCGPHLHEKEGDHESAHAVQSKVQRSGHSVADVAVLAAHNHELADNHGEQEHGPRDEDRDPRGNGVWSQGVAARGVQVCQPTHMP